MTHPATPEQLWAWDLRGAWAGGWEVSLRLDDRCDVRRVRGLVERVSVTGAFAVVAGTHVPCALILAVRRPHFTEPLDAVVVVEGGEPEGQMLLFES